MRGYCGLRANARLSALWGRHGRTLVAVITTIVSLAMPVSTGSAKNPTALVPSSLLAQAKAHPSQVFHVTVQGHQGDTSSDVAEAVGSGSKQRLRLIPGVAADLTGKQLVALARNAHVLAITPA
jgi:hypothetical protein